MNKFSKFKLYLEKKILCKTALFKHLNAEKLEFENKLNILATNSLKNTTCFKMLGNLGNQMFIHAAATSIIKVQLRFYMIFLLAIMY